MRHDSPPHPRSPDDVANSHLRAEHRRLRRAFGALLAAIAPAAVIAACTDGAPVDPAADAGADAQTTLDSSTSTNSDAGTTVETGADAAPDASDEDAADAEPDAPKKNCTMKVTVFDSGIPGEPGCLYVLPCGLGPGLQLVGCDLYSEPDIPLHCSLEEGYGCQSGTFAPGPDGEVHINCPECLGGGRRPTGLARLRRPRAASAIGAYFARMTHAEAASVVAFDSMRDELAQHGAPEALLRAAERASRDEVRHARIMARRARAHGAAIPRVQVRRRASRSLESIARENAVEGCVNETFGALVAAWQAQHAPDADLRRAFARIAADEARHAALSWAVARWIDGRLDAPARARVARARARAVRALQRATLAPSSGAAVGLPGPRDHAALLSGMIARIIRAA